MYVFDGLTGSSRTVKLRGRQVQCAVCGDTPSISSLIDYNIFCGSGAADDKSHVLSLLSGSERITCQDYHSLLQSGKHHLLIDVRQKSEFDICHLDHATSILSHDTRGMQCIVG